MKKSVKQLLTEWGMSEDFETMPKKMNQLSKFSDKIQIEVDDAGRIKNAIQIHSDGSKFAEKRLRGEPYASVKKVLLKKGWEVDWEE